MCRDMRKVEYVYLHGLLYEIRTYLEESTTVSSDAFGTYDDLSTRPAQIYKPKEEHEEAIKQLSADLADEMTQLSRKQELIEQ